MLARIINLDLLKNPYNWIIVALMVGFAVVALTLVQPVLSSEG